MMNRYKPVGWRGESHRHYLAAKGYSTKKYLAHKYMAEFDQLGTETQVPYQVGNRKDSSKLQTLHALRWTDPAIRQNVEVLKQTINPKTGLPFLDEADVKLLDNKFSGKQKASDVLPPPNQQGGATETFNTFGFGPSIPTASFQDEKLTTIPSIDFGPSMDVPQELPETQEMQQIESDVAQQNIALPSSSSEPAPLTEERLRQGVATPPPGLPENLLI